MNGAIIPAWYTVGYTVSVSQEKVLTLYYCAQALAVCMKQVNFSVCTQADNPPSSSRLSVLSSSPQASPWAYLSCAVGAFVYQALDAIDGKQARRTRTNTPLGELFDHGCDAITTFLAVLTALSAVAIHTEIKSAVFFTALLLSLNFVYHWQTYVCGVLHFKK